MGYPHPYGRHCCHLGSLPKNPGTGYNSPHCLTDLIGEVSLRTEVTVSNEPKDLVNGGVRWEGAVVYGVLPLEALGDVVPSAARVDHGGQELDVDNVGIVSRLFQAIKSIHFHELPHNLIGHL